MVQQIMKAMHLWASQLDIITDGTDGHNGSVRCLAVSADYHDGDWD